MNDNDTIDNGNSGGTGSGSGNGSGDGLLNGAASGNGEHNYGIGNGNGDDVDITAPITGVLISLVTLSQSLAIHLLVQLILLQLQRPIQLMTMT